MLKSNTTNTFSQCTFSCLLLTCLFFWPFSSARAATAQLSSIYDLLLSDDTPTEDLQFYLSGFDTILTDHPASLSGPRSPKHILSSQDYIALQFHGTPGKPNYYFAQVQTASSIGPITVPLVESDTPGIYRNTQYIYLSDSDGETIISNAPNKYRVRAIDEEIFTATVTSVEGTHTSKSVMVDEGEYGSCGIHIFYSDAEKVAEELNTLKWIGVLQEFKDTAGNPADSDHTPMQNFIKKSTNDATYTLKGESDFLHFTAHGDYDGRLVDNDTYPPISDVIIRPTEISQSQHYTNDVDWIFINACNTLNHFSYNTGLNDWMNVLAGTNRRAHALLGYDEPVSGDLSLNFESFFSRIGSSVAPETILNGFFNAMTDGSFDEPCAMVFHEENLADKFQVITQDSNGNRYRYYWYNTTTDTLNQPPTIVKTADGTIVRSSVDLKAVDTPNLAPVIMRKKAFKTTPEGYRATERHYGLNTLDKDNNGLSEQNQDAFEAEDKGVNALQNAFGPLPRNAYGPQINTLNMQRFQWENAAIPLGEQTAVSQTIRYEHILNGVPVIGDVMAASVSGNRVTKLRGCWHEQIGIKLRLQAGTQLLNATNALEHAVKGLNHAQGSNKTKGVDETVTLNEVKLCYYGFQDSDKNVKTFNPTWQFQFTEGSKRKNIYVDAQTGNLRPDTEINNAMRRIQ